MNEAAPVPVTRGELAAMIDATLLRPEATDDEVRGLCREARELAVFAVCVSATMVSVATDALVGSDLRVAAVIGFPSGAHRTEVKALEAGRAVADGAGELDMVVNLAAVRAREWRSVEADIAGVRAAAPAATLKVILEAGALQAEELAGACRAAEASGAEFVKTSTGVHRAGGATVGQVRAMAEVVAGRLGVKAAGGIRSAQAARELIEAGATRLGVSAARTVLAELPE